MKRTMLLLAAGAMALSPTAILAAPSTSAQGWDHFTGPASTG